MVCNIFYPLCLYVLVKMLAARRKNGLNRSKWENSARRYGPGWRNPPKKGSGTQEPAAIGIWTSSRPKATEQRKIITGVGKEHSRAQNYREVDGNAENNDSKPLFFSLSSSLLWTPNDWTQSKVRAPRSPGDAACRAMEGPRLGKEGEKRI